MFVPHRSQWSAALAFSLLSSLSSLAACDSGSDTVSRRDCQGLRDHMIDLRMASVTADQVKQRIALRAALGESFIASCIDSTSETELRCALAATDSQAVAACNHP